MYTVINTYIKSKKGSCEVYPTPFSVELGESNKLTVAEPDISVICSPDKLTDKGCSGSPDWIIEIVSPSNSSLDYVKKLNPYATTGVREYSIVNPMKKSIFVYYFEGTQFQAVSYTFEDNIQVNIYEDFSIDFSTLL